MSFTSKLLIGLACMGWFTSTLDGLMAAAQNLSTLHTTIELKNQSPSAALEQIETQSGVKFIYDKNIFNQSKPVTLSVKDKNVIESLHILLSNTHIYFKQYGNRIALYTAAGPAGQSGNFPIIKIQGKVIDGRTGAAIPGATIRLKGTSQGTISDASGNFSITSNADRAIVIVTYIGYINQTLTFSTSENLTIRMEQNASQIGEVLVQARRRANNEVAVLRERQNSSVVSDAISAKQIEKTASITTTQALQRVTGVTITDDKYVAIRGLGDRSVVTELNGVRLSSANPDRSAAPLDLVPAALLENITVYKTLTPDRPADATAGIIELKTKSIPDSLSISFTAQVGFNSEIGLYGGRFNAFPGYDLGYFGQRVKDHDIPTRFLDLQRQYPGGTDQIKETIFQSRHSDFATSEAFRINNIERSFSPVLATHYEMAVPNQIYTVNFGNVFKLFHNDLGLIVSANYYNRTEDRNNGELNQYFPYEGLVTGTSLYSTLFLPSRTSPAAPIFGKYVSYKESDGLQTLNYGVLGGLSYRFNQRNEVSFQYLASRGAEAEGRNLSGQYDNTNLPYTVNSQVNILRQSYRVFNTLNLQGEHKFLNKPWSPQLSYNLSKSTSSTDEPDNRTTIIDDGHISKSFDPSGSVFTADHYVYVGGAVHGIGPQGSALPIDPNGRRFRHLSENNYNFKFDLSEPFTVLGLKQGFKAGFNYLRRDRNFLETMLGLPFSTTAGGTGDFLKIPNGDINTLVSYANVGLTTSTDPQQIGAPRFAGFLYNSQKSPNNYKGFYLSRAFYAMLDLHVLKNLRLAGGVRLESTDIKAFVDTTHVTYPNPGFGLPPQTSPNTIPNPNTDIHNGLSPYYSLNITYVLQKTMNLRFAYNTSLARPELREITQIYQYDPGQFAVIGGNPKLFNQFTRSFDFRYEWFPTSGEVYALSLFTKRIFHQLTKTFSYTPQGTFSVSPEYPVSVFQNDPEVGKVYGLELEARKNLVALTPYLKNFYIGANLLLDASEIKKNPARLDASKTIDRLSPETSPVFEQAPYALNAYLDYDNYKTGSNATISFNEVGERLVQVQLDGTPDLYDRPAPLLDFVFSQHLGKRFLIKGFAKNLLNPSFKTVYALPGNQGTYRGSTYINRKYFRGREFSLGLTFNLF